MARSRFVAAVLGLALVCFGRIGFRQTAAAAADDDRDWIALFDGKTLEGWHTNPEKIGHGTGGHWAVDDGAITGEQDPPGSGNGGILLTDRKFADFELTIDMKPDWGVCSGLFIRSTDQGQCYQMMVDYHDAGNVGHLYGEGTGGFNNRPFEINGIYENQKLVGLAAKPNDAKLPAAYSVEPEAWVKAWKLNDWNTARVRCVGQPPQITTWINGVKVSVFDGKTFQAENYDAAQIAETLGREGSIAVQVHGGNGWPEGAKCRWKNVKIKVL
ncbi:MAG TPA: DUF1080 domain-containing protein [Pirellulales bacterium]|nr:DUF1080 domain-containing protein [Pirellulales bacterium]